MKTSLKRFLLWSTALSALAILASASAVSEEASGGAAAPFSAAKSTEELPLAQVNIHNPTGAREEKTYGDDPIKHPGWSSGSWGHLSSSTRGISYTGVAARDVGTALT